MKIMYYMWMATCAHKEGVYRSVAAVIAVLFTFLHLRMCVKLSPFTINFVFYLLSFNTKWRPYSLFLSHRGIRWFHNTPLKWSDCCWRFIISGQSIYLPDLERCLKMVLAHTRELTCLLLHHLVILLLGEAQSDGVMYFLCQRLWFTVRENNLLSNLLYCSAILYTLQWW